MNLEVDREDLRPRSHALLYDRPTYVEQLAFVPMHVLRSAYCGKSKGRPISSVEHGNKNQYESAIVSPSGSEW